MKKEILIELVKDYVKQSPENYIKEELAISTEYIGQQIFNDPIFGFASPDDELFNELNGKHAIGTHFMQPDKWLENCKTVISIFLPFNKQIIRSNEVDSIKPSNLWLHGRIEGQRAINKLSEYLLDKLKESGYKAVAPSIDNRLITIENEFTSSWSERHIAYISGLGTFGLSKGIITNKGMAGRFTSIITDLQLQPSQRDYNSLYGYCTMCGACIKRCPVNAISFSRGKDHGVCNDMVNKTRVNTVPERYGCGKCQTKVPCAIRNPSLNK